jgi:hypothetical protein
MTECPYCGGDETKCDFSFTTEGCHQMNQPLTFSNGLSQDHDDKIDEIMIDIARLRQRVEELGNHRSYSLAITKLEEASHWMRDRKHKAPRS